jgi:hypothetical protein
MSLLSERIRTILDENPDVDQPTLGTYAGVTKGTVNQWLDGKIKSIKLEYAAGIQERLGYNAVWLVLGKGQKRLSKAGTKLTTVDPKPEGAVNLDSDNMPIGVQTMYTATAEELKQRIIQAVADEDLSPGALNAIAWIIHAARGAPAKGDQHHVKTVKQKHERAPHRGRTGTG